MYPHRLGYDQDITEEDSSIHPYDIYRLSGNLGNQLWGAAAGEEVIFGT